MESKTENQNSGLHVLDSMTDDEFRALVEMFSILLKIDVREGKQDTVGDSNSESVALPEKVK